MYGRTLHVLQVSVLMQCMKVCVTPAVVIRKVYMSFVATGRKQHVAVAHTELSALVLGLDPQELSALIEVL